MAIAGRYGVPELWFPTNLLALTEATANALVDAGVWTVAASIDGVTQGDLREDSRSGEVRASRWRTWSS